MFIKERTKRLLIKNSVLRNFLVSYCVVFLFPLIIIFSIYYNTASKTIKTQIFEANITAVKQAQSILDNYIRRSFEISFFINESVNVISMYDINTSDYDSIDKFIPMRILDEITPYQNANPFIDYLYIYFFNSKRGISSSNSNEYKMLFYHQHVSKNELWTIEQWENTLKKKHTNDLIVVPTTNNTNSLYYMQTLPILEGDKSDATVVFRLDTQKILDSFEFADKSNQNFVAVIDESNQVLLSDIEQLPITLEYNTFSANEGLVIKEGYIISYCNLEQYNAKIVWCKQSQTVLKDLLKIQFVSWIVFFVCILIGALMTYYFTMKNYNPIKQIFNLIQQFNSNSIKDTKENEFNQMMTALMDSLDEKYKYEKYNFSFKELQTSKHLINLIKRKPFNALDIQTFLESNNISITSSPYCLVKITLSDYSLIFFDDEGQDAHDILQPLFIVNNTYKEILSRTFSVISAIDDNTVLIIIQIKSLIPNIKSVLTQILSNAQIFLRDNYAIDSYVSVSKIHENTNNMPGAYNEVIETTELIKVTGKQTIAFFDGHQQKKQLQLMTSLNIKEEDALIGSIIAEDFQEAKNILILIFNKSFWEDIKTPEIIRLRLFSLSNKVIEALSALDISNMDKFTESLHPFTRILKCSTVKQLQTELNKLLDEIDVFLTNEKPKHKEKSTELKMHIISIVKESYTDPNLNVSYIAQLTNKNVDYISRYFKKMTHIGLLDYIHQVRIKSAKELLINESSFSVREISKIVGYTTCDSFIRVFKRFEGMTPGKYRKLH